jgi:acetate---CoA ligase (ADP-forming)
VTHALQHLLAPNRIAFVGAIARPNTVGHDMLHTIRRGGFAGTVYPVNPGYDDIDGVPCYANLAALPQTPDLAVLAVRNDRLEAALRDTAAAGIRAAVIFASCILPDDTDPPLHARLAAIARSAGIAVCGGNCMGFYNDLDGVWICGFPSQRTRRPGAIALLAHSGSVFGALAHNDPRLRFAFAISPGQEMTVTVADYLDYVVERPEVRAVGLFLETARDPAGLRAALAKAAQRRVPVVALKVGRTEAAAAAALTHTGAVAGSDAVYAALFDRYGVLRVETLDEMAATLLLLQTGRLAAPGGVVAIHDSGGEREMTIDLAERTGVPFAAITPATRQSLAARLDPGLAAENPLDAWGTGENFVAQFTGCFTDLLADPNAALGLFCADFRDDYYLHAGFAQAARAAAATTDKPVAIVTSYTQLRHDRVALELTEAGVPVLDGSANGLVAARGALAWRDFLARPMDPPPPAPDARAWLARLAASGVTGAALSEAEVLDLLGAFGIPTVPHALADSAAEAVAAASRVGFPVALKTAMPGIAHKSERGGVVLDLRDAAAVREAYGPMAAALGPRVMLARMLPAGPELALGAVRDPQFGPVIVLGAGGTLVELLDDRVAALPPFGPATARRLLDRLRLRRLLDGFRGGPATDLAALADLVARFSVLVHVLASVVREIDVNPVICGPFPAAVDGLLVAG